MLTERQPSKDRYNYSALNGAIDGYSNAGMGLLINEGKVARSMHLTPEVAYSYDCAQLTHSEAITGSETVTPIVEHNRKITKESQGGNQSATQYAAMHSLLDS